MSTVYDIICKNRVENPFATMLAVILIAIDKYIGSASIAINNIHIMLVLSAEAQ